MIIKQIYVKILVAIVFVFLFAVTGCQSQRGLMPTPNLYLREEAKNAFSEVPKEFQTNYVDLLYVTDRVGYKYSFFISSFKAWG